MQQLDSEQDENFSEENTYRPYVIGSSLNNDAENQRRSVTFQKADDFVPLPPFTKRKENMVIEDVVKDYVLCFLPAKSLIRFRSVSKDWDHRIRSPFLAHQQTHSFRDLSGYFCQSDYDNPTSVCLDDPTFVTLDYAAYGVPSPSLNFLPGPVNLLSSSNGLLLCQDLTGNNGYYVCNPVTQEWKELPESMYYHGPGSRVVLAFEPSVLNMGAHYQVICAVPMLDQPIVCFELYSSQTMSWRCLDAICVELGDSRFVGDGFYMKGIAYWRTNASQVLALDLKDEVHGIMSLPNEMPSGGILAKLGDELSYIGVSDHCVQIYSGACLSLRYRIDIPLEQMAGSTNEYRVLPSLNSNVVMILAGRLIYTYDLSNHSVEEVTRIETTAALARARFLPYVNSLVMVA